MIQNIETTFYMFINQFYRIKSENEYLEELIFSINKLFILVRQYKVKQKELENKHVY